MADFSTLKAYIASYVKQNGVGAITGEILQDVLLEMVEAIGDEALNSLASALGDEITNRQNAVAGEAETRGNADTAMQNAINAINTKLSEGYVYAGIATTTTNPGTLTGKVFYFALAAGTYTYFVDSGAESIILTQGISILKYNGTAWSSEQLTAIDNAPTDGSSALVKSGGVFTAIAAVLNKVADGYLYRGIATTSTNPPTPQTKVFYIATAAGTYTNFGGTVLTQGINILKYDGSAWSGEQVIGIDNAPTAGSNNLVKSRGVSDVFNSARNLSGLNESYDDRQQLEITWTANSYYNSSGQAISYDAPLLKSAEITLPAGSGNKAMMIGVYCEALEYCLFVDNNGVIIERWQQTGAEWRVIPYNATKLLLTNLFSRIAYPYVTLMPLSYVSNIYCGHEISIWNQWHYWKNDGTLETATVADHGDEIFASDKIDVTSYKAVVLKCKLYNAGAAYSLFMDENDNVLQYWQSNKTDEVVPVPYNAKWLCLTCFISQRFEPNPYAFLGGIGDITPEVKKLVTSEADDISPVSWDNFYYYNKNGVKTYYNAEVLAAAECDVTNYQGKEIRINAYTEGVEYCLFVDGNGNILQTLQPKGLVELIVPVGATTLKMTNVFRNPDGIMEPYVFAKGKRLVMVSDIIEQGLGNSRVKVVSQKKLTENLSPSVQHRISLDGKVMAFLGDSITAISNSYPNFVAPYYNATLRNLGANGTTITRGIRTNPFIDRVTQANIADADFLCILGGVNDFLLCANLGVPFTEETIAGSTYVGTKKMVPSVDTGGNYTFCGCLHELIAAIRDIKPTIPILYITPLQESYYEQGQPDYASSYEQNATGAYQKDYVNAIKEICQYYSIPVLDAFSASGIDFKNDGMVSAYCWNDRLHPSAAGSEFLANLVIKCINEKFYVK